MATTILQITLLEHIDNFCMSKGSTLEFKDGGHKWAGTKKDYYPNFGPYIQLNEIADRMHAGLGNSEMDRLFTVKEIKP